MNTFFDTVPIMSSRSSIRFLCRILTPMANSLYTLVPARACHPLMNAFRILPAFVFTNYCRNRNKILPVPKFVYTLAGFFLLIFNISCRTPSQSVQEEGSSHLEQRDQAHDTSQLDDTTTITHKHIDSTSTVTQIIRKVIYDKDHSARSLQDLTSQSSRRVEDTLTPALINTISKGFAVACIGLGLMVLGFFVVVVILIFRLSKGT